MDVKDYCNNLSVELSGWKAKMYDIVRKLDKLPTGQKEKFSPQIGDLHMIIEELEDRVERLQKECPTEWKPDEVEINKKISHMQEIMKDVWTPLSIGK